MGGMIMALYNYDSGKIDPEKLARFLDLTFCADPGPYCGQLLNNGVPVGYIVRFGVVSLPDDFQIPAKVPLKRV
jgi:hypothetical protein